MKCKLLFVYVFLLSCQFAFAAGFELVGNISGLNHTKAYLEYLDDRTGASKTDSCGVFNGHFALKGNIETPALGILYFHESDLQVYFFFGPGKTSLNGSALSPESIVITGGSTTELFKDYRLHTDTFKNYRRKLVPLISGDSAIKDSALHAQYMDRYYTSLSDEENYTEKFIKDHPNSYVSAYLLFFEFSGENNISKGMALLDLLGNQIKQSKYCRQLLQRNQAFKLSATGMVAPVFTLPDSGGKAISVANLHAAYVLIDFWASWCGPCRRENPGLVKAWQKFHDKGFEILSVSLDEDRTRWLNAIQKDTLSWMNVCDFKGWDSPVALQYAVSAIPANFLIDKNGIVIGKNLMGTALDYTLTKLLLQK